MLAFVPKLWLLTPCLFSSLLAFALHFLLCSVLVVEWHLHRMWKPHSLWWLHSRLTFWEVPPLGSHGTWLPPHYHPCHSLTKWSQLGRRVDRYLSFFIITCGALCKSGIVSFSWFDFPITKPAIFDEVLPLLSPFNWWGNWGMEVKWFSQGHRASKQQS